MCQDRLTKAERVLLEDLADDVRARLHLDSAASAEFVCAKAIKDGVIDAVIDHDNQQIRSKGVADVYSTNEPQKAFHRRIVFCLDVRNEAVKAMQYPPDTGKKKQPDEDDKEEKQTDEEIAKEIEERAERRAALVFRGALAAARLRGVPTCDARSRRR